MAGSANNPGSAHKPGRQEEARRGVSPGLSVRYHLRLRSPEDIAGLGLGSSRFWSTARRG